MDFEHFDSAGYGDGRHEHDGEEREDGADPILSELLDIASGRTELPEFRNGGSPSAGEYTYDVLADARIYRGDEGAYELAEGLVEALRGNGYDDAGGAEEVLEAALAFLEENDRLPEE